MATHSIDDAILPILLRYFRSGTGAKLTEVGIRVERDREYLRIHWALSKTVAELAEFAQTRRHEAQASLEVRLVHGSGAIRGRLAVLPTFMRRAITGDSSVVSYLEPTRTYKNGPNHVLGWVLRFAEHVLRRYVQTYSVPEEHQSRTESIFRRLEALRSYRGIGEVIGSVDIRARPTAGSLTQASRSRKSLYRAAYSAYRELQLVEQGREETLRRILGESLLGPVEKWRRFELLLALRMAEALSYAIQRELILNPIETAGKGPLASCGRFDIYWQNQTTYYKRPDPEPSEQRVERLLGAYRVRAGGDRPDVIVVDRDMERPVAIAEAKYVSGEFSTWENAMREAAAQVVRYSRGFVDSISQDELLRNSILAISTISQETTAITPQNEPVAFNQYQLLQGDLSRWTSRIIQH